MIGDQRKRVVVIGGGFSGCCFAINLVRRSTVALAVTIIETRPALGRGLAYSTTDPEHRLNAPTLVHSLIPEDAWHFARWCLAEGLAQSDPEAMRPDGASYQRRCDFARYIEQTVREHSEWPSNGSNITHLCDQALSVQAAEQGHEVRTRGGQLLRADLVVFATGNHMPGLPPFLDRSLAGHPSIVGYVFDGVSLKAIASDARVLLVGAGLTALDALSTLVAQRHRGPIDVLSRHGLRPKAQGPMPPALALAKTPEGLATLPGKIMIDRIMGAPPVFLADPHVPLRVSAWLRILRQKVLEAEAEGKSWHLPFDELRDTLWQLWPRLPLLEKRRFLRCVRPWYDAHRYRTPPQNDEMVRHAEAQGRIAFRRARVLEAKSADSNTVEVEFLERGLEKSARKTYDVLINCSGLDGASAWAANPVLASMVDAHLIRPDPCGLGIEVDAQFRPVNGLAQAQSGLRFIGPPTLGMFGDPIGAMFIAAQIHRLLPDVLQTLQA